jgi:hypothetical protein
VEWSRLLRVAELVNWLVRELGRGLLRFSCCDRLLLEAGS